MTIQLLKPHRLNYIKHNVLYVSWTERGSVQIVCKIQSNVINM